MASQQAIMAIAAIVAKARRQAGAFSREQATVAGFSAAAIKQNLAAGQWVRLYRGVFALAGSPDTPLRRLWAAQLSLGDDSVASHRSALWLWGVAETRELDVVEFTVAAGRAGRRQGITVHRVADIEQAHISIRRGVCVTSPLRTVVDAGAVLPIEDVEDVFDRFVSKRLFTPRAALAEIERLAQRGRAGVGALRHVLLDQGVGSNRSPSFLEAKARRLFKRAGLPDPVCELKWGADGQFRLDFAWPDLGLVVEVDGWDCHSSHRARQHDLRRRNRITLGGMTPDLHVRRRSAPT